MHAWWSTQVEYEIKTNLHAGLFCSFVLLPILHYKGWDLFFSICSELLLLIHTRSCQNMTDNLRYRCAIFYFFHIQYDNRSRILPGRDSDWSLKPILNLEIHIRSVWKIEWRIWDLFLINMLCPDYCIIQLPMQAVPMRIANKSVNVGYKVYITHTNNHKILAMWKRGNL